MRNASSDKVRRLVAVLLSPSLIRAAGKEVAGLRAHKGITTLSNIFEDGGRRATMSLKIKDIASSHIQHRIGNMNAGVHARDPNCSLQPGEMFSDGILDAYLLAVVEMSGWRQARGNAAPGSTARAMGIASP